MIRSLRTYYLTQTRLVTIPVQVKPKVKAERGRGRGRIHPLLRYGDSNWGPDLKLNASKGANFPPSSLSRVDTARGEGSQTG